MTPEQARLYAKALLAAADQAEMEGRDLIEQDLDSFADLDTEARADLAAAITRAQGR